MSGSKSKVLDLARDFGLAGAKETSAAADRGATIEGRAKNMAGSTRRRLGRAGCALAALIVPAAQIQAASEPTAIVCGVENVEDLVPLPDSRWIIGSGIGDRFFQNGALHLIDVQGGTASRLTPVVAQPARAEAPYDQCPGPARQFSAHGIALSANADGSHNLYVVNHGGRESIEVFKVTTTQDRPVLAWIGCVLTPPTATANSVAVRPSGELVMSATSASDHPVPSFHDMSVQAAGPQPGAMPTPEQMAQMRGAVFLWNRAEGWRKVPGSELLGNNGIELSKDGDWAYVNAWTGGSMTRLPLDPKLGTAREIKLDFKPDNIRWSDDGKLVATGHVATVGAVMACVMSDGSQCAVAYRAAEIDPDTLRVSTLFDGKGTDRFGTATIGLKTKGALWLGSVRSPCVAKVTLPAPNG